jgi:hypothetical protein
MRKKIFDVAAGLAFLASAGALAQSSLPVSGSATKMPASTASFCGTVVKLTERGCIGVKSMAGQPTYEITSATPKPIVGMLIAGSGTTAGASICAQGAHLMNIAWQRTQACPQ